MAEEEEEEATFFRSGLKSSIASWTRFADGKMFHSPQFPSCSLWIIEDSDDSFFLKSQFSSCSSRTVHIYYVTYRFQLIATLYSRVHAVHRTWSVAFSRQRTLLLLALLVFDNSREFKLIFQAPENLIRHTKQQHKIWSRFPSSRTLLTHPTVSGIWFLFNDLMRVNAMSGAARGRKLLKVKNRSKRFEPLNLPRGDSGRREQRVRA